MESARSNPIQSDPLVWQTQIPICFARNPFSLEIISPGPQLKSTKEIKCGKDEVIEALGGGGFTAFQKKKTFLIFLRVF